jgi:NADH-quinone oxidoreductase subunit G
MCDYGRLNFKYLEADNRLLEPQIFDGKELASTDWKSAINQAALQLRQFSGANIAIIASGRMTNEELWLTRKIAELLGVRYIDIVPCEGEGDDILLSEDRNPNTTGARLILRLDEEPGAKFPAIAKGVKSGAIRALVALGENPIKLGISAEQLTNMPAFIAMDILSNPGNEHATVLMSASGFAEKRGSMINGEGRLQRLNRAVRPPGNARDDWEILRDLLQALVGSNGIYTIEDLFRQMSAEIPQFAGLSLSKIGDLGVHVIEENESPPPPDDPKAEDIEEAEKKRPPGR